MSEPFLIGDRMTGGQGAPWRHSANVWMAAGAFATIAQVGAAQTSACVEIAPAAKFCGEQSGWSSWKENSTLNGKFFSQTHGDVTYEAHVLLLDHAPFRELNEAAWKLRAEAVIAKHIADHAAEEGYIEHSRLHGHGYPAATAVTGRESVRGAKFAATTIALPERRYLFLQIVFSAPHGTRWESLDHGLIERTLASFEIDEFSEAAK